MALASPNHRIFQSISISYDGGCANWNNTDNKEKVGISLSRLKFDFGQNPDA